VNLALRQPSPVAVGWMPAWGDRLLFYRSLDLLKRGTLVTWWSGGNPYTGFIIGTCSYDNAGDDKDYIVRYVWQDGDWEPRHPFGIVAMDKVTPVKEYSEDCAIGGYWSACSRDRCDKWKLVRDEETGHLLLMAD
jgi:hypothetical protein